MNKKKISFTAIVLALCVIFSQLPNAHAYSTLRYGASGNEVKTMQTMLNTVGAYALAVDGIFGASTLSAVRSFQSANSLAADGICGVQTWAKLESKYNSLTQSGTITTASSIADFKAYALKNWVSPIKAQYLSVSGTSRAFGASRDSGKRNHAGMDYYVVNGSGTPVYAMASGKVIEYNPDFYASTASVAVENTDGSILRYCEIDTWLRVGYTVKAGQQIGTLKANSINGGTMLHLELYRGNASGSLSANNYSYTYVSGSFKRRRDLMNPEFLLSLGKTTSAPVISITSAPTSIKQSSAFHLRGSVNSASKITRLEGYILNSSGKTIQTTLDYPYSTYADVRYLNLNQKLSFGSLSPGSYTLKIRAVDANGKTATYTKAFTVYK